MITQTGSLTLKFIVYPVRPWRRLQLIANIIPWYTSISLTKLITTSSIMKCHRFYMHFTNVLQHKQKYMTCRVFYNIDQKDKSKRQWHIISSIFNCRYFTSRYILQYLKFKFLETAICRTFYITSTILMNWRLHLSWIQHLEKLPYQR